MAQRFHNFAFNFYSADYNYDIPKGLDMSAFHEHIESIPSVDSPLIFGLHPNADITYRLKEASEMLTTIIETQPKDSTTSVGKSVDEQVEAQAQDLLEKVPSELVEEVFRALIHRKDGLKGTNERGFRAPLNIFLFQELQRLANIISIVRSSLENLIMAIEGTVVMTVDLLGFQLRFRPSSTKEVDARCIGCRNLMALAHHWGLVYWPH